MNHRFAGSCYVIGHALALSLFLIAPLRLGAQPHADSLAVIAAMLNHLAGSGGTVLLAEDSPELVIAASELMANGRAELLDGRPIFCGGELARELVRPGDTVGRRISISLTPGVSPPREPQGSIGSQQTRPRDFTNAEPQIVFRAFHIDAEVAYVAVSFGCLMRPGGASAAQPLDDGRVVAAFGSGATYELRRDNSGWSVVAVSSMWIT